MTLYINSTTEKIASNNIAINGDVSFILKGQYNKKDETFAATISIQNDRYTELEVTFPADFKDQHKNGIYYYSIQNTQTVFEKGLCKLITEPGGDNGAIEYTSTPELENREADTFFRPNY